MKIAINGFGRIGRSALKRVIDNHPETEVVAINDLAEVQTLSHLLKHDTVYGIYEREIGTKNSHLLIGGKEIRVISEPKPENLPWKDLKVDVVLECTGRFTSKEEAEKHLKAGAKKVIISANSKTEEVPHFVLGVNEEKYLPKKDQVVANCSCTTNCAAPVIKALHQNFNILKAQMSTVHAVTSSQNLVDAPHKDWRRARAAFNNIVPTTTGAAKAVTRVLPELEGLISGSALRVPVICGSILEIVAQIEKEVTVDQVNKVFEEKAKGELKGILSVSNDHLASSDIIGNPSSAIVDLCLTEVLDLPGLKDENLIKVAAWYDNEYAYACRLVELAEYIGQRL